MIRPIRLSLSNAYLVQGQRPVLVDTGAPGESARIVAALAQAGVSPADLSLIVHTHVHSDHVGSTLALRQLTAAPLAYHAADQPIMERGHNGALTGIGGRGRAMALVFRNRPFEAFAPDVWLEDGLRLDAYGVAGRILVTPGHTAGSISVILDGGQAIIGDVVMGGYLGGNIMARRPNWHYFADDAEQLRPSLAAILQTGAHTLYVGHGGPLTADAIRQRFGLPTPTPGV